MGKLSLVLFVILFSLNSYANSSTLCEGITDQNPYADIMQATQDLQEVVEANKKRVDLLQAKISYSFAGIGVGKADVFLMEKEGKIVDLNVYAKVGVLGINQEIKQKVTIDQLKAGQPLEFEMDGGDRPVLVIEPSADFDENGGWATLKIWNGNRYDTEKIAMFKKGGKFKAFKETLEDEDQITGLDVNMNGMSVPSMYVRRYKIKTKG
ncbi:MAG: hypothetical protein KC493_11760 [Bacteriovoracaceae bacterium]|nr:hypothetical protein [Bacteriovoracaceae bacterium]